MYFCNNRDISVAMINVAAFLLQSSRYQTVKLEACLISAVISKASVHSFWCLELVHARAEYCKEP